MLSDSSSRAPRTVLLALGLALPLLFGLAFAFSKYVLFRLIMQFDAIKEYIFLLTIGWCLGIAQLAHVLGLSHEIGAFVAGKQSGRIFIENGRFHGEVAVRIIKERS